jgi:hypothetical protein
MKMQMFSIQAVLLIFSLSVFTESMHQIYGFDKDKPGTTALSMFIDSETGEVFINDIK